MIFVKRGEMIIKKYFIFTGGNKDADGSWAKKIVKIADQCGALEVKDPEKADVLIVLGGDGTIMRAARTASASGAAIIGINLGRIGYMAELSGDEIELLSEYFNGNYTEDRRMMLRVTVGDQSFHALNDAIIHAKDAHMSKLLLKCGESEVSLYRGDGLILATPTGSTAYSMSAGGSVIEPKLECICVTPICPQSHMSRPLVFAPENKLTVTVESDQTTLTVDGAVPLILQKGERVTVEKSEIGLRMIKLKKEGFYSVLRNKSKMFDF